MNGPNKLEQLFLAAFSNLDLCFQVRPEPTKVKHLLGVPF